MSTDSYNFSLGFVQKELVRDLLRECDKMYEFNHPNVLKLTGVCMDGGSSPYIIMPFMANGSLDAYLKKERGNLLLDPNSTMVDDVVNDRIFFTPHFIKLCILYCRPP